MKHSYALMCALALLAAMPVMGQSDRTKALSPIKPNTSVNPINPLQFCADPTAVEYEGRLYVYGSNDNQEYEASGGKENNGYGHIKSLVVMSTADMVNWTMHGTIDMASVCGSWMGNSWAPSIVSRVEDDGLTHFYMYFSNGGGGVGVVTATHPLGPWTDPLRRTFINGGTPGVAPCSWPFDPGVVIDDEGTGWLTLGGGDPVQGASALYPRNSKIVKLGPDMLSLASDFTIIPAPYQFEASELNYINGKYVYTYCSSWSDRNQWPQAGIPGGAPSTCSMCYMVSDNPLDPESWVYGGDILKNPGSFGYPWGNNHTHMHKFNDQYYMFYHTQVMENLAGIGGGYRSIGVDKIDVDEENVKISAGKMTAAGPAQIKENMINALELQQAETMSNGVGFKIANLGDGNTCITNMQHGGWTSVKKVDFGEKGANKIIARLRGSTGLLEVRLDRVASAPVATIELNSGRWSLLEAPLKDTVTGVHTVFFLFTDPKSSSRWDTWQFAYDETTDVLDIQSETTPVGVECYNIDGMPVGDDHRGFCIRRTTFGDGSVKVEKIIR